MRLLSPIISGLLIPLVAVLPLRAELPAAASNATAGPTTPGQANVLRIRLADETKAMVEANSYVKGYAVLVTDGSGLPVPDAAVAIRFPEDGATGFFVNGERSAVAYTDASGVAKFPQVNWAANPGTVSIRVTAVKGDMHAGALIEQTVVTQAAASSAPAPLSSIPVYSANNPPPSPSDPPASVPATVQSETGKKPGVPVTVAAVHSGATPDPTAVTPQNAAASEPAVSVVNTGGSKASNGNTKKWLIVAAVIAAGGIGAALALSSKGAAAAATTVSTGTSIGTPTVSLGH